MWVSKDGSVKKSMFEFNSINHFLVENNHSKAVEVAMCILSELVKENKKDIMSFDIDKIEVESKHMQDEYEQMLDEVKAKVKEELEKTKKEAND